MSLIQSDLVKVAYKKLKRLVYYEKPYLFLRKRLAEFECAEEFERRLEELDKLVRAEDPIATKEFQSWLKDINFVLVPKSVKVAAKPTKDEGTFVTNVTSAARYDIEKVNYIFDGPIELHLIGVLWLMVEGHLFDRDLGRNCLGSRLHPLVGDDDDHSAELFKKYHELYAKWRDDGISKAEHLLVAEERSVCIIGLDLQEYYYRIQLDWDVFRSAIARRMPRKGIEAFFFEKERLGERLCGCIKAIFASYRERIASMLPITHDLPDRATCLPIGFCASPVIANWYLKEFDKAVLTKVRPAYYSRYVDDILLVVASEAAPESDPIKGFMGEVLVNAGVMTWNEDRQSYGISEKPGLFLQKKKCILQFFEAGHSIAGLEKFRKELAENASDFALLPVEGDESPVETVAYDLLYDGPVNKLRSVKEIAENRWELAKHLSKQTQLYLVAGGEVEQEVTKELFRFFRGRNAIDYWDMWERVIAFMVITGNGTAAGKFIEAMKVEVKKLSFSPSSDASPGGIRSNQDAPRKISIKLRGDLVNHLELSLELSRAVRGSPDLSNTATNQWRSSNLIRHHLVAVPLLNYTNYNGDLAVPEDVDEVQPDRRKIEWSPRFVHFDECLSFIDSGFMAVTDDESIEAAQGLYKRFHGTPIEDVKSDVIGGKPGKKK